MRNRVSKKRKPAPYLHGYNVSFQTLIFSRTPEKNLPFPNSYPLLFSFLPFRYLSFLFIASL